MPFLTVWYSFEIVTTYIRGTNYTDLSSSFSLWNLKMNLSLSLKPIKPSFSHFLSLFYSSPSLLYTYIFDDVIGTHIAPVLRSMQPFLYFFKPFWWNFFQRMLFSKERPDYTLNIPFIMHKYIELYFVSENFTHLRALHIKKDNIHMSFKLHFAY